MNVSFELRIGNARIPVFIHPITHPVEGEIFWPWLGGLARQQGENQPMWENRLKRDLPGFKLDEFWFPSCSVCGEGDDVYYYIRAEVLVPFCEKHKKPGDILVDFRGITLEKDRTPTQVAQDVDEMTHLRILGYHDQKYSQRQIASMMSLSQTTVGYHIRRHEAKECRCFAQA